MITNPYEALGVSKQASQDDIKNAYRNLAKKYHPDLNPGNKGAEKKFKEINSANELLSNPEMKAKYDRGEIDESGQASSYESQNRNSQRGPYYHETQREGGRYSTSFGDMNADFFESLFGGRQNQRAPKSGQDLIYKMEIEFTDAVLGKEKEIILPNTKKFQVKIQVEKYNYLFKEMRYLLIGNFSHFLFNIFFKYWIRYKLWFNHFVQFLFFTNGFHNGKIGIHCIHMRRN